MGMTVVEPHFSQKSTLGHKSGHVFSPAELLEPRVKIFLSLFHRFSFVIHLDLFCFITLWDKIIYEEAGYNCLNFIGGNIVTWLLLKCCCCCYHIFFFKGGGSSSFGKIMQKRYSPGFWNLASYHLTIFIYLLKEMLAFHYLYR